MVPDKFNMVDMEGIDLIESQGLAVTGLYQKLVDSTAQCRYQCLYNWKFDGIIIPPSYVEMVVRDGSVWINEGVSVDEENVIHIYSIEPEPPAPVEPTIEPLQVIENGVYTAPEGIDGYSPVSVSIPAPKYEYLEPDYAGLGYSYVALNNNYYSGDGYGQMLSIYEVPAGDYVVFCGNPVGTRFRCLCFYGKIVDDFMPVRDVSMTPTIQFEGNLNVTGITERTGDTLIQRLYFTMAQAGCVAVGTSNTGQSVESILLKINS